MSCSSNATMADHDSFDEAAPPPSCSRRAPLLEEVPLLVTVLAGNVVTAAVMAACLNAADATVLRRLHPAIAVVIAGVPWADTTTPVWDLTRWRAALPAAVGCILSRGIGVADVARLPPTLRLLDVSYCQRLTPDVSFAHLLALETLNCRDAAVVAAGFARLPPSLRKLRIINCVLPKTANFNYLRALQVLECNMLSAIAMTSLPPSLEILMIGCSSGRMSMWPPGGSLAHLTRLRVLRVARTCIDAAAVGTFPPSLHSLHLGECKLAAATSFAHLRCLRTLNASRSEFDDGALATLPPSLVSLDVHSWVQTEWLTPAAVFPHLPALRMLNMCNAGIGDAAVASMPPGLEALRITNCGNVTQQA